MEDMKWFGKKFGIIFVILLVMIVSTGIFMKRMREHHQQRRYGKCD